MTGALAVLPSHAVPTTKAAWGGRASDGHFPGCGLLNRLQRQDNVGEFHAM